MNTLRKISADDIHQALEQAAADVTAFKGSRVQLVNEIIEPLQDFFRAGKSAGFYCTEQNIRDSYKKLQRALCRYDKRLRKAL